MQLVLSWPLAVTGLLLIATTRCQYPAENFPRRSDDSKLTEFTTDVVSNGKIILERHLSPYVIRRDVLVEQTGELLVEPGVTVYFAPRVGITVKGILTAKVNT